MLWKLGHPRQDDVPLPVRVVRSYVIWDNSSGPEAKRIRNWPACQWEEQGGERVANSLQSPLGRVEGEPLGAMVCISASTSIGGLNGQLNKESCGTERKRNVCLMGSGRCGKTSPCDECRKVAIVYSISSCCHCYS